MFVCWLLFFYCLFVGFGVGFSSTLFLTHSVVLIELTTMRTDGRTTERTKGLYSIKESTCIVYAIPTHLYTTC